MNYNHSNLKYILSCLLCFLIICTTHGQFSLCNSPTSNDLYDVHFMDQNVGIIVGSDGTILRSSDGGTNWTIITNIDSVLLKKVKFFAPSHGITIGNAIYVTHDAGLTWVKKDLMVNSITDISILNDSTAILTAPPNRLFKTYDRGTTFEEINNLDPALEIAFIGFSDENTGYGTGEGGEETKTVYKTSDGGKSWRAINTQSGIEYTIIEAVSFVTEKVGFRGGWYNPHLMRTIDGGLNWERVSFLNVPSWEQSILDFHIQKDQSEAYYACGWYGNIFKSTDEGLTWTELNSGVNNTTSLYGIYFITPEVGWAVGAGGMIIKTTTGGTNSTGTDLHSINTDISLYPNPSSQYVHLNLSKNTVVLKVSIFDSYGREMPVSLIGNKISLSHFETGVYHLICTTSSGSLQESFVKK